MDLVESMVIEKCRKTLAEYHADALSVIRGEGIEGGNYSEVWLAISLRLWEELDAKGKTDGALSALGEFLHRIESTQRSLEDGRLAEALLNALAMVHEAHQLRGRIILREDTAQKVRASTSHRPKARSTFKPKIVEVLKEYKRLSMSLKEALGAWIDTGPNHGIVCSTSSTTDMYEFVDQNAVDEDQKNQSYTLGSLQTYWGEISIKR